MWSEKRVVPEFPSLVVMTSSGSLAMIMNFGNFSNGEHDTLDQAMSFAGLKGCGHQLFPDLLAHLPWRKDC